VPSDSVSLGVATAGSAWLILPRTNPDASCLR
jgi:hypothetical protein